ncbi:hypothetical protein [Lysinibacillus fusiformis]|nr:hypothetical protein [Lysinibacillus fusiformis]
MEDIKNLTNKQILRQQLELLAERSEKVNVTDLPMISSAMVEIFKALKEV